MTTNNPEVLADELARARVRVVAKNITDDREGWLTETLKLLGLLEDNWPTILRALRSSPSHSRDAVLEEAAAVADIRRAEWEAAIANGLQRVSVTKAEARHGATELEVLAFNIRALKSQSPVPTLPEGEG